MEIEKTLKCKHLINERMTDNFMTEDSCHANQGEIVVRTIRLWLSKMFQSLNFVFKTCENTTEFDNCFGRYCLLEKSCPDLGNSSGINLLVMKKLLTAVKNNIAMEIHKNSLRREPPFCGKNEKNCWIFQIFYFTGVFYSLWFFKILFCFSVFVISIFSIMLYLNPLLPQLLNVLHTKQPRKSTASSFTCMIQMLFSSTDTFEFYLDYCSQISSRLQLN